MSEPVSPTPGADPAGVAAGVNAGPGAGLSAGALLRAAREERGLALDQLAQLLKVPVAKLEALEADRHEALPGLAFVRGLATAMARQMGTDPQPILAALPSSAQPPQKLESVTRGLATPYREPGSRSLPLGWPGVLRPAVIAPIVLLLLALLFWLAPSLRGLIGDPVAAAASAVKAGVTPASAASESGSLVVVDGADTGGAVSSVQPPSASAVVETVHSAPPEDPAASRLPQAAAGAVVLRTTADSWVEVRDGGNAVLLSRMLPAGEVVGLDGAPPFRLKIGNAEGTRVHFRGEAVDLAPQTRDNVARIELK